MRDEETDTCWRFAFVANQHALERVQTEWKDTKPTLRFIVIEKLVDKFDRPHHANPFEVTPEQVIETDEKGAGSYIFLADAALARVQTQDWKWDPTMFTQIQRGMDGACGSQGKTSDPGVQRNSPR